MELIYRNKLEMLAATFVSLEEKRLAIDDYEYGGWFIYKEYLDDDRMKIVTVFAREIG